MVLSNFLPLEQIFYQKSRNSTELPNNNVDDYFNRYVAILNYLRREVYPHINVGLASLSGNPSIYTSHGPEHFDEVVKFAGQLLDIENNQNSPLNAYDLYVLLLAIRLHDAGNIFGREGHEKKAYQLFTEMGNLAGSDNIEKR